MIYSYTQEDERITILPLSLYSLLLSRAVG